MHDAFRNEISYYALVVRLIAHRATRKSGDDVDIFALLSQMAKFCAFSVLLAADIFSGFSLIVSMLISALYVSQNEVAYFIAERSVSFFSGNDAPDKFIVFSLLSSYLAFSFIVLVHYYAGEKFVSARLSKIVSDQAIAAIQINKALQIDCTATVQNFLKFTRKLSTPLLLSGVYNGPTIRAILSAFGLLTGTLITLVISF